MNIFSYFVTGIKKPIQKKSAWFSDGSWKSFILSTLITFILIIPAVYSVLYSKDANNLAQEANDIAKEIREENKNLFLTSLFPAVLPQGYLAGNV